MKGLQCIAPSVCTLSHWMCQAVWCLNAPSKPQMIYFTWLQELPNCCEQCAEEIRVCGRGESHICRVSPRLTLPWLLQLLVLCTLDREVSQHSTLCTLHTTPATHCNTTPAHTHSYHRENCAKSPTNITKCLTKAMGVPERELSVASWWGWEAGTCQTVHKLSAASSPAVSHGNWWLTIAHCFVSTIVYKSI